VQLPGKELYSVQCESVSISIHVSYRFAGVNDKAILCVEVDKYFPNPNKEQIRKELLDQRTRMK
jgi:hypothetical protein